MKRTYGFTLIELMVVVAIIAILAAIALPSYEQYVRKSRRIDAKNALTALQMAEEKYRANNLTYTSTLSDLGLSATSPQGFYTIAIANGASATAFSASATITGVQAVDTGCQKLVVTQAGFDKINSSDPATCWGLN